MTASITTSAMANATRSELTAVDFDPFVDGEILLTVPATESQQEIWLAVQISNQANLACLLSQTLRLTGQLDLDALQAALAQVVSRHESLRTTFSGDGMTILIAKKIEFTMPIIDLTALPDRERASEIEQHQQQAVSQAFDLQHGPLFRAKIIKVDAREHLVILTVHQIVCDGWSLGVIKSDLAKIYNDLERGIKPKLDPPAYFSEYACSEQEKIGSLAAIEIEKYWVKKFENLPPVLELPTDYPRPPIRTFNSACENYTLTASLVEAIEQVGIKHGCSLMTTLLAAFEVFLYKLTGQTDLTVGVPTSGQIATGKYNLVGHCINFLPVRAQLDSECKFSDYLRARNRAILDDYDRQDFTFGSLLKHLAMPRDASRIPLISAVFNVDLDASSNKSLFNKLEVETIANRSPFSTFEFFWNAAVAPTGEIELECQYNTNLFRAETIHSRLTEFENLLTHIVEQADRAIFQLSVLNVAQEHQLLVEWNQTHREYPHDRCIHQLFEQQVERTPDAVAVVFEEQQLTYRELNSRANQLAYHLKTLGVAPDVLVGICIDRSLEMMVGLLGILKAGGAYVPLDPDYPQQRLASIIQDTALSVLVTKSPLIQRLPAHGARIVSLDRDLVEMDERRYAQNPPTEIEPNNLAYVIYTSGSTGTPKGVLIEHRALVNYTIAAQQEYQTTQIDRVLQFTSLNFDVSAEEIYTCLTTGATLVIRNDATIDSIATFLAKCLEWQITVISLPTAYWHELTAQLELEQLVLPPSLRLVIIGGEPALRTRLSAWYRAVGGSVRLINAYGPTEATISALMCDLSEFVPDREIPIGRPLPNVQAYVLDRDLQPVPVGIRGELYIGGVCLARGYRNRPDLTTEKFIVNPFGTEPNSRLYRTGDLVRYLPNGDIEYLCRIDNQVKIRGFRIELGEIEASLVKHPAVSEVAVIDREDRQGDRALVAYLVAHQPEHLDLSTSTTLTSRDLRAFLQPKLPEYMIPSAFVMLKALPLTPNGKIDRRALPTPDYSRQESEDTLVVPRDELELQLTKIWERVLGVHPIGIRDNFFESGGHSLIAVKLFNEIEQVWGRNLPLATLFEKQTIEEIAVVLRQEEWSAPWSSLVLIRSGGAQPPLFCIHPVGGNILEYYTLAKYIGQERSIYGLQSQGLDGKQQPFRRVEDMASHYINEIRTIQPHGPYLMTGYSFGGLVAFEMAQQLEAQGQKTALLALLDSAPKLPNIRPSLAKSVGIHLINLWKLKPEERLHYIMGRIAYRFRSSNQREYLAKSLYKLEDLTPQLLSILNANLEAFQKYTAQVYSGDITLLRCQVQNIEHSLHPELGWSDLVTGQLDIHHIPGPHFTMLKEPRVRFLAEILNRCLQSLPTE